MEKPTQTPLLPFVVLAALSLSLLYLPTLYAGEIAVSPMLIEINGKGGERKDFSFNIRSKGGGEIAIRLFDITQQKTGHMQFIEADLSSKERPPSWVKLPQQQYSLSDGDSLNVEGELTIPRTLSGSHFVAVTVESKEQKSNNQGISVTVRYAVVLKINITGRKARMITQLDEVSLDNQGKRLLLVSHFSNLSKSAFSVESQAQLRDAKGKLVERIELKSLSAWQRQDQASNIIPGARIQLVGPLSKVTEPGEYQLIIRPKVDGRSRRVWRSLITISKEQLQQAGLLTQG